MKALFFDIDGTLMDCHGAGKRPLELALTETFDFKANLTGIDWMGRTDSGIVHEVLEQNGLTGLVSPDRLSTLYTRFHHHFESHAGLNPHLFSVLPGVHQLLQSISNPHVGLLTGNIQGTAFTKLKMGRLESFFPSGVGAFGEESPERNRLFPLAIERFEQHYRATVTEVIVIGDSLRDIECARANGAKVLAVGTGKVPMSELEKASPDWLFTDLSDTGKILPLLH